MRIAFYAPLKSPEHAVPSGDRLMARLLIRCLTEAGHDVTVASHLRAFLRDPADAAALPALSASAADEQRRLGAEWRRTEPPRLWLTYHPYYKAPDLIGPPLCAAFGLPYVTVEASYSARRNTGLWADTQALVLAALRLAAVNICMTGRDSDGLRAAAPDAHLARLRPFIDAPPGEHRPERSHITAIAMMRPGDKWQSYRHLAAALALLPDRPWVLSIVGDGPLRAEITALFAHFAPHRIRWHGQLDAAAIGALLARTSVYVWPGCGEAYGLAYLEAQAAGVAVVAFRTAGVPEVVADGLTGILTPPDDDAAFAAAIARLLDDDTMRTTMSAAARETVRRDHSVAGAAAAMQAILRRHVPGFE